MTCAMQDALAHVSISTLFLLYVTSLTCVNFSKKSIFVSSDSKAHPTVVLQIESEHGK